MVGKISDANRVRVNRMNRAATNIQMGTLLQDIVAGSGVTVNAASASLVAYNSSIIGLSASAVSLQALINASGSRTASGSELDINTGLAATPKGYIVQCNRSGSVSSIPLYVSAGSVAGHLKINSGSSVSGGMISTDVITYFTFA